MRSFGVKLSIAVVGLAALLGAARHELIGSPAPDFALKSATGANFRLSEFRGRVVLLSFWASWCGECRSQLASLTRLGDSRVDVLAVSLDRERTQVIDTVEALGIGFPALHDAGGLVGEEYEIDDLPHLLVIDQEGIVRGEFAGYSKGDERAYLEQAGRLHVD